MYSSKNYRCDGGDTLVIGGKLIIKDGAVVEGLKLSENNAAVVAVSDSTATTVAALKGDFNKLLAALRSAGVIAEE